MTRPPELEIAVVIDGLAQRYGCTPSVILNEPVSVLPIVELAGMNDKNEQKKSEAKVKSARRR